MKLHQGPEFIDGIVNSTKVEGTPKRILFSCCSGNHCAVRQLILQDRHMTYREIETALDINGTSIHSILHEHLTAKNNLLALGPIQFFNR